MGRSLITRWWRRDRPALVVLAVGSLLATIGWRGRSRPMLDTVNYRQATEIFAGGWDSLTDRTPGYPLLLWLTGSADGSTHLLFAVQLVLHASTVLMVVDLARRHGVGHRGRAVLAALLVAPPVMLRVVHEGTEGLSAWFLTLIVWLLLTPATGRTGPARALGLGALCGAAALVRPTFALLWLPVAAVVALQRWRPAPAPDAVPPPNFVRKPATEGVFRTKLEGGRRGWGRRLVVAGAVALPAVVLIGGYSLLNGVRFDSPGLTPLAPYHLSSRTSAYVEELPASYEPARSVLIAERDRALLRGEEMAPTNFSYEAEPGLERVTGLSGPDLDRYLLEIDLHLITHHPFDYLDAVMRGGVNYLAMDSQAAILGLGRPAAWGMAAVHWVLVVVFLATAALVPGLVWVRRVPRATVATMAVLAVMSLYVAAVSTMTESGTARLRSPTEPLLALLLVIGLSILRANRPTAADPEDPEAQ